MIRVNLLPSERRKAKAPAFGLQSGQKIALGGSLILLLAALFVGWRYWALGQDAAQVERDIEAVTTPCRAAGVLSSTGCEPKTSRTSSFAIRIRAKVASTWVR